MPAKKSFLFITDPFKNFDLHRETTLWMMLALNHYGHDTWAVPYKDLILENSKLFVMATRLSVTRKNEIFSFVKRDEKKFLAESAQAIILRKDPPVDTAFYDHLTLLESLRGKTLLINDPTGIKQANEKILPQTLNLTPSGLATANHQALRAFVLKNQRAVLKPLNLSGGRGIVIADAQSPSLDALIDLVTESGQRFVIAQEFVAAAKKGDTRVLLLDGKILGAFKRIPSKKDFRGNLHSGAKLAKATLTPKMKKIISSLEKTLANLGLYFVGLDFLGDFVTEINVTSPMGLGEVKEISGIKADEKFAEWLIQKL